jgi:hypothetical protein
MLASIFSMPSREGLELRGCLLHDRHDGGCLVALPGFLAEHVNHHRGDEEARAGDEDLGDLGARHGPRIAGLGGLGRG